MVRLSKAQMFTFGLVGIGFIIGGVLYFSFVTGVECQYDENPSDCQGAINSYSIIPAIMPLIIILYGIFLFMPAPTRKKPIRVL